MYPVGTKCVITWKPPEMACELEGEHFIGKVVTVDSWTRSLQDSCSNPGEFLRYGLLPESEFQGTGPDACWPVEWMLPLDPDETSLYTEKEVVHE